MYLKFSHFACILNLCIQVIQNMELIVLILDTEIKMDSSECSIRWGLKNRILRKLEIYSLSNTGFERLLPNLKKGETTLNECYLDNFGHV